MCIGLFTQTPVDICTRKFHYSTPQVRSGLCQEQVRKAAFDNAFDAIGSRIGVFIRTPNLKLSLCNQLVSKRDDISAIPKILQFSCGF